MSYILIAENVDFQDIIKYPHIEIEADTVTFICGESGCGKSTLLKLFNGAVSPSKGEIRYDGRSISEMNTVELRKENSLVSQSVFLFDKTIKENFEEYYSYRDMPVPEDETIKFYLSLCCIDFKLDTLCISMSGGERHRIYIAIFLSFLPKVLMLDEPTSALDNYNAAALMKNIISFCKEKKITLLVVSHDKAISTRFADRTIELEKCRQVN